MFGVPEIDSTASLIGGSEFTLHTAYIGIFIADTRKASGSTKLRSKKKIPALYLGKFTPYLTKLAALPMVISKNRCTTKSLKYHPRVRSSNVITKI